jgi:small-conductance mechanosensitive channel
MADKPLPPSPLMNSRGNVLYRRAEKTALSRLSQKRHITEKPAKPRKTKDDLLKLIDVLRKENDELRQALEDLQGKLALSRQQHKHDRNEIEEQDRQIAEIACTIREAFKDYQESMQQVRLRHSSHHSVSSAGSRGEIIQVHSAFSDSDSSSIYSE